MKLTFLGTGTGGTLDFFNTCFVISNDHGYFLVDTGGGCEVRKRLKIANIDMKEIKDIFVSHSHTDHILGLIWMYKNIGILKMHNEINDKINVYCNDVVYEAIKGISNYVLPKKLVEILESVINYVILRDGDTYNICGVDYTFFDIHAKDTKQFGFKYNYENQNIMFLGDETLSPELYDMVKNADFVMHEAFCLDSEADIFHPYEKNHSTALSTAKIMNDLDVKTILLYHTEDNLGEKRKEEYTKEAKMVYKGNVIVPDELEEIEL
ncbi:MAG: MBL fold metallo-hydrolase [Bacilli bacterium]|nr:MBL fold metallo-hydrolase [Bacilli bacterium]